MRLFLKDAAERRHTAKQAVSRLTEQRQQAQQQRKEEKDKLKVERERIQELEQQMTVEKQQEAERQAILEKQHQAERQAMQEREQTAIEKQQEAERQAERWKAVAADYKESLEQYEEGYQRILEQLKKQEESFAFLKEKQEYMLKNFPTLEANIVDKIRGVQSGGTQEVTRYLEEMTRTRKRNNLWTKILLGISLLFSGAALGGMIVLLLYFSDRIAL